MRCSIWYHLYNLKNVKNAHRGVLLLAKLQLQVILLHACFSRFLNCTKVPNRVKGSIWISFSIHELLVRSEEKTFFKKTEIFKHLLNIVRAPQKKDFLTLTHFKYITADITHF